MEERKNLLCLFKHKWEYFQRKTDTRDILESWRMCRRCGKVQQAEFYFDGHPCPTKHLTIYHDSHDQLPDWTKETNIRCGNCGGLFEVKRPSLAWLECRCKKNETHKGIANIIQN